MLKEFKQNPAIFSRPFRFLGLVFSLTVKCKEDCWLTCKEDCWLTCKEVHFFRWSLSCKHIVSFGHHICNLLLLPTYFDCIVVANIVCNT